MARAKKPLPSLEWLEPRVKLSRPLSLFSFIALLTLLLVWNLAFAINHYLCRTYFTNTKYNALLYTRWRFQYDRKKAGE